MTALRIGVAALSPSVGFRVNDDRRRIAALAATAILTALAIFIVDAGICSRRERERAQHSRSRQKFLSEAHFTPPCFT
jgi:hypothetical protein